MHSLNSTASVLATVAAAVLTAGCTIGPEQMAFEKPASSALQGSRHLTAAVADSDRSPEQSKSEIKNNDAPTSVVPVSFETEEPAVNNGEALLSTEQPANEVVPPYDSDSVSEVPSGNGLANVKSVEGESLEQAWSVALAVDQSLQATRWGTSAAQRGLFAARSEYLPSLSFGSSYNASDEQLALKNPLPVGGGGIPFANREFVTAGLTVSQPIFTSGKITSAVEAAGAGVTASQTDEVTTRLDVRLGVAEAYINVLRAQRALETAQTAIESLTEHERVVGRLVEEGVVVRNDLLAVKVQTASVKQASLATQNTLDVARAVYNRALGRPLASPVVLQEIADRPLDDDVDRLTSIAISRRPETAKLSALARSLRNQADAVKADSLPQFFAVGGYNSVENRYFVNEVFTTVSVVGEWNLFDSGRNKHKSEQLMQSAEALIRTRTDVETKIALQVRSAWLAVHTAREQLAVNETAIESADENLRVSRNRYEQETVTNTVVQDAVTLRTAAYNLYHNSKYDIAIATMRLRRAVGDL
jgi:outer membrane protein